MARETRTGKVVTSEDFAVRYAVLPVFVVLLGANIEILLEMLLRTSNHHDLQLHALLQDKGRAISPGSGICGSGIGIPCLYEIWGPHCSWYQDRPAESL